MKSTIGSRKVIRYMGVVGVATALTGATYIPARAQLLTGQTLQLAGYEPSLSSPPLFTAKFVCTPGLDYQVTSATGFVPVNIYTADMSITLLYPASDGSGPFAGGSFNGYVFTDINGTIPTFTNATVDPSTTLHGFGNGNLSFDANNIYVNVSGLSYSGGNTITIDLSSAGTASAPEPGMLPLMGSSTFLLLGGLQAYRRKRR